MLCEFVLLIKIYNIFRVDKSKARTLIAEAFSPAIKVRVHEPKMELKEIPFAQC